MADMKLFCFGLGYTAQALIRALPAGWQVAGTCRSEETAAGFRRDGIDAHAFDGDRLPGEAAAWLAGSSHVLSSVPPGPGGDPIIEHFAPVLAASDGLRWLGYLSTTGVYGDRGGAWVDETTPTVPTGPRGARREAAEQAWLELWHAHGRPVHLFRLAGIYGPGRSALDSVRAGRARRVIKPGQVFSRIHVDDIVSVLLASMARPRGGAVYNLCDDEAAPPQDVIAYAAELLGVPPPPEVAFDDAELSPMARSFYAENKRVRNQLIKEELGVRLAYPNYRLGLLALLEAERQAG